MNKQKVLNLLGIAMRARKLTTGEEFTLQDIRNNKAKLVFIASDASDNTRKKITDKCSYYKVLCNESLTQLEISQAIGRIRKVIAVSDPGFATKLKELIKD